MPTVTPSLDSEKRTSRYAARELLRTFSTLKRLKGCGVWRARREHGVPVVLNDGRAHFQNVQLCASVHACPVCAPRIRQRRADEVTAGVEAHLARGGGVEFVTVTLPHDEGDALEGLLRAVKGAWRAVLSGRAWVEDRDRYEVVGTIRALEVNHGPNGWHPHLHVLVFTARPLVNFERVMFSESLFGRWRSSVVSAGYRAPTRARGVDVRPVRSAAELGGYVSKVYDEFGNQSVAARSAGLELARHDLKASRGRAGYRSAFAIARDLVEVGDADDLALWWEYERATKGTAALRWSKGLKALLGVGAVTDAEIVDETVGGETVAEIEPGLWSFIGRLRGEAASLLRLVEVEGVDALQERLWRLDAMRHARERAGADVLCEAVARPG